MTETTNYHLNQWIKTDRIRMEDFNADNEKLDAALAQKCEIVVGTYTGDGQLRREIVLGFKPRAVLVVDQYGRVMDEDSTRPNYCGGLAVDGAPVVTMKHGGENHTVLETTETGFAVVYESIQDGSANSKIVRTNDRGTRYNYIAFM